MLAEYASANGFENHEFYVDDGYSGTSFERPDFERMLGDIEKRKISTVITKDLSRLGARLSKDWILYRILLSKPQD